MSRLERTVWVVVFAALVLGFACMVSAEEVRPDGTRSVTNNDCTTSTAHTTMDDDPQSPGGDWCTAPDNNSTAVVIQFASPSGSISTATDAQTFRLYVRRDAATSPGNGEPTARMDAYDATSLIETGAGGLVTSDSGQLLSESWTSNTSDGTGIEVDIVCTAAGGGPNQRGCDFDAVEWDAALAAAADELMVIGRRELIRGEIVRASR